MGWGSCIKHKNVWSEENLNFTSIKDTEAKPSDGSQIHKNRRNNFKK